MDVRLVIVRGAKGKPTFRMPGTELIIGRQHGCGIRVPAAAVSRQHCRLRQDHGVLFLEDLGSANGTRLNDVLIDAETEVQPGDEIGVGPIVVRVEYRLTSVARGKQPALGLSNSELEFLVDDESSSGAEDRTQEEEPIDAELVGDEVDEPLAVIDDDTSSQTEYLTQLANDENKPLDLPEGDELRALLADLEDDTPKPSKSKPRR